VRDVHVEEDAIVFENLPPDLLRKRLLGAEVRAARRKGKQLWLEIGSQGSLLIHLGMTGHLRTPDERRLKLAADTPLDDGRWPPRFAKLHLVFDDDGELVFTNSRRFGRVRWRQDPRAESPVADLGFDPLLEAPSVAEFQGMLSDRKGVIKSLLLNQRFVAGVGNWIADEVLFRAGIDPRRRACDLTLDESRALHESLGYVIEFAVSVDADKRRFPDDWLFHRRWGKAAGVTTGGDAIEFVTIGGRTTAWVPSCQR
jgi:formamidopyrimidine-DNA glycosylase